MLGLGSSIVHSGLTRDSNAIRFNGGEDYIRVDDDNLLSHSGTSDADDTDFSVACWVKRDHTGNQDGIFIKGLDGNVEYHALWSGTALLVDVIDGNGVGGAGNYRRRIWTNSSTSWQHLVFVVRGPGGDSLDADLYVNGSLQGSSTTGGNDTEGMTPSDKHLYIGRVGTLYQLAGSISNFTMWQNYALDADEVTYLYASGSEHKNPLVDEGDYSGGDEVVLWLPLDGSFEDSSGNDLHSTPFGNTNFITADTLP